ncbi:MAG: protease inhibitor I42 family protein [Gammaproteobacteria bacterium]|nr:protease inhibitor I42 family protein [Gammaproteobacteria bacterium]
MLKKISLGLILAASISALMANNIPAPAQVIQLSSNQQNVDITLPANATTGYQWYVTGYDHNLLSLNNYRYNPPTNTKLMGAPGQAVFTFTIDPSFYNAPQVTTVMLNYQRPNAPTQNATTTMVTISSIASQNDSSAWQKYPSSDGSEVIIKNAAQEAGAPDWISLPPIHANS